MATRDCKSGNVGLDGECVEKIRRLLEEWAICKQLPTLNPEDFEATDEDKAMCGGKPSPLCLLAFEICRSHKISIRRGWGYGRTTLSEVS